MKTLRPWMPLLGLGVLLVVATIVAGPPARRDGPPLAPDSPGRRGTKGVIEVLRELGADVRVSRQAPDSRTTTAAVLADNLGPARRRAVIRWVREGGVLVLADPASPLNPFPPVDAVGAGSDGVDIARRCRLVALREVRRVSVPPDSVVLRAPTGSTGCFPRHGGHFLVTRPEGRGEIVVLGGPWVFTNERLDDADNGVLAAALLAPRGDERVDVLRPPPPGGGRATLADLVEPPVKLALVQLGIAFVVVALWRARRLGRPVLEPQPVQVAGSELVVAVGHLLQRAGRREHAAVAIRDDLRRSLAERLGLPVDAPAADVAAVAARRTSVAEATLTRALAGPLPRTEAELVAAAQLVESVRREVSHVDA